ncbi:MAG: PilZ domain-containing protein [Sphingomicrobium sp.]
MADQDERRRGERVQLNAAVDFRRPREQPYPVRLHDLTAHGCRIDLPEHVSDAATIWVTLPGLESLASRVRWESNWNAGVEFKRPMHPAVFDHISAKLA